MSRDNPVIVPVYSRDCHDIANAMQKVARATDAKQKETKKWNARITRKDDEKYGGEYGKWLFMLDRIVCNRSHPFTIYYKVLQ